MQGIAATRAARSVLAIVQVGAILWFRPREHGFPLDDAWIHQVVARTFATTGTLGMVSGEHGAGATSWLWALLSAVNLRVLHVHPVIFCLVLSALLHLGCGQLVLSIAMRVAPAKIQPQLWTWACVAATALAFCSGNALWFVVSGMEADLVLALSVLAIFAATSNRWLLAGIACALLALTRPDAVLLGALLVVYARKIDRRSQARLALPWLFAVVLYASLNLAKSGHVVPPTLAGRRWLWLQANDGLTQTDLIVTFAGAWLVRLRTYVFETHILTSCVVVALAIYGLGRVIRLANPGLRLLFLWGAIHCVLFAVALPATGHGGRYQPLLPVLFVLCAVLGIILIAWELTTAFIGEARLDVLIVAVVLLLPSFVKGMSTMKQANGLATRHIETTEIAAGRFVRALPPGIVASFDMGAIVWEAHRPIVDLGGLTNEASSAMLIEGRTADLLAAHDVKYLVLPEDNLAEVPTEPDFRSRLGLYDHPALKLVPLFRATTPRAEWITSVAATSNAAPVQTVYEVTIDRSLLGLKTASTVDNHLFVTSAAVEAQDRHVLARMLHTLAQAGVALDLHVGKRNVDPLPDRCMVTVDLDHVFVSHCPEHVEATILELALPFLDANDVGGAARAATHAVARVARLTLPLTPLRLPRRGPGLHDKELAEDAEKPLIVAAATGEVEALTALFARGVNEKDAWKALDAAVRARQVACVRALLPRTSAVLNVGGGERNRTVLHHAVLSGDETIVTMLLARGANVEALDSFGESPLHLLVDVRDAERIAPLLVEHNASIETLDRRGFDVRHAAARADDVKLLRGVRDAAGNIDHDSASGETALDIAIRYHATHAEKFLRSVGAH